MGDPSPLRPDPVGQWRDCTIIGISQHHEVGREARGPAKNWPETVWRCRRRNLLALEQSIHNLDAEMQGKASRHVCRWQIPSRFVVKVLLRPFFMEGTFPCSWRRWN